MTGRPAQPVHPVRLAALAALALIALLAAGCTVNPATGRQSFTAFMPPAEEARLGAKMHPEVSKEFGGPIRDQALAAYVDRIGQSLARTSETPNQRFTFTVLESDIVNAFAVPGGYVYVTRALVALAANEAELAGVLAHEIGHITARHTAERYSRAVMAQLLVGVGAGVLGSGAAGDIMAVGAAAYLQGFSREQEYESDLLGVRYLMRAGYEPQAMSSFLAKLQAESRLRATLMGREGEADRFSIMSTHPRTADRVGRALDAAGAAQARRGPAAGRPRRVGADDYMRAIDGLSVDGDPVNGFIKGSRFVHPAGRFQFVGPPGYRLFSGGEQTVIGLGPGHAAFRVDWVTLRRPLRMTDFLLRVWARGARVEGAEAIDVNGMEAATGLIRSDSSHGPVELRLIAVRSGPGRVHRFIFLTPRRLAPRLSVGLRRATFSFRRLTPNQAARERPYRLRVSRAGPGATVARLAARMPYESHRLARFQVLNGLAPGARLAPGRWIKLVGE